MAKRMCPITREQFRTGAKMLKVEIAGQTVIAPAKEFSTDSLGWYGNGKLFVEVDGVQVECQVGLTITAIGSKELPK